MSARTAMVRTATSARTAALCVVAVALLGLLSGCGSSASSSTSTVASPAAASAHGATASTPSATQPGTKSTAHPTDKGGSGSGATTAAGSPSAGATSTGPTRSSAHAHAHSRAGSHASTPARSTTTTGGAGGGSNYSPVVPPGTFAIASPAFPGENVALPAQYTCDGANISPPLEWRNPPAHTAALVLSVSMIDNAGSTLRWNVANISPSATSVAEGATPQGGIVGANSEGHSAYGGICPPHGQTASIQIELFALSHTVSVSTGFQASQLEHEYTTSKLLLGTAVDTTTYRRG